MLMFNIYFFDFRYIGKVVTPADSNMEIIIFLIPRRNNMELLYDTKSNFQIFHRNIETFQMKAKILILANILLFRL